MEYSISHWIRETLMEIIPEYSLEGLMLKLKLQYFGHLMKRASVQFSSVQSLSHVQLFVTPWTARLPFLNYLPEFAQIHVHLRM